ncbi:MAG TPA: hypothetical protein VK120_07545, partial [Sporosarcina sp.]|nr:hypothetical protein [Sporosarcina sp.]
MKKSVDIAIRFVDISEEVVGIYIIVDNKILFVGSVKKFVDIVIRFVDISEEVVGIYIIVDTRILFVDSVKRFVGIQSHNCKHDKP